MSTAVAERVEAKPAQIGANVLAVEMAAERVARCAAAYRVYPNFSDETVQEVKANYFQTYQEALEGLMEAING